MDINSNLAARAYSAAKPATQPEKNTNPVAQAAGEFAKIVADGEQTAKAALTGGADPHALVQALAQTELAVETAVTVRNKVVEAYQEILRMPV